MIRFTKITHFGLVWLTALLTLVAGLPHIECRCPTGRIKPFCLGFLFEGGAIDSCCGAEAPFSPGTSCAPLQVTRTGKSIPSCCCHRCSGPAPEAASQTCVDAARCTRTLMEPVEFIGTPCDAGAAVALDCVALLSPGAFAGISSEVQDLPSWQGHSLAPPPTDLITVLERLTI